MECHLEIKNNKEVAMSLDLGNLSASVIGGVVGLGPSLFSLPEFDDIMASNARRIAAEQERDQIILPEVVRTEFQVVIDFLSDWQRRDPSKLKFAETLDEEGNIIKILQAKGFESVKQYLSLFVMLIEQAVKIHPHLASGVGLLLLGLGVLVTAISTATNSDFSYASIAGAILLGIGGITVKKASWMLRHIALGDEDAVTVEKATLTFLSIFNGSEQFFNFGKNNDFKINLKTGFEKFTLEESVPQKDPTHKKKNQFKKDFKNVSTKEVIIHALCAVAVIVTKKPATAYQFIGWDYGKPMEENFGKILNHLYLFGPSNVGQANAVAFTSFKREVDVMRGQLSKYMAYKKNPTSHSSSDHVALKVEALIAQMETLAQKHASHMGQTTKIIEGLTAQLIDVSKQRALDLVKEKIKMLVASHASEVPETQIPELSTFFTNYFYFKNPSMNDVKECLENGRIGDLFLKANIILSTPYVQGKLSEFESEEKKHALIARVLDAAEDEPIEDFRRRWAELGTHPRQMEKYLKPFCSSAAKIDPSEKEERKDYPQVAKVGLFGVAAPARMGVPRDEAVVPTGTTPVADALPSADDERATRSSGESDEEDTDLSQPPVLAPVAGATAV